MNTKTLNLRTYEDEVDIEWDKMSNDESFILNGEIYNVGECSNRTNDTSSIGEKLIGYSAILIIGALIFSLFMAFNVSNISSLSGTDEEILSNAQSFITKKLRSPSSYSMITEEVVYRGKDENDADSYIVRVEYDAANGFGTSIRDCKYVSFALKDGKSNYWSNSVLTSCNTFSSRTQAIKFNKNVNFFRNTRRK